MYQAVGTGGLAPPSRDVRLPRIPVEKKYKVTAVVAKPPMDRIIAVEVNLVALTTAAPAKVAMQQVAAPMVAEVLLPHLFPPNPHLGN